jgi:hypothetical protein
MTAATKARITSLVARGNANKQTSMRERNITLAGIAI